MKAKRSLFDWQIATRLPREHGPMYHRLARTRYLMTKLNQPLPSEEAR